MHGFGLRSAPVGALPTSCAIFCQKIKGSFLAIFITMWYDKKWNVLVTDKHFVTKKIKKQGIEEDGIKEESKY